MKDKEYHEAKSGTFVSKTLIPPKKEKMDEFNFKPAHYYVNKIWAISKWM